MKHQTIRSWAFASLMLVFFCLLITGSPRLIGREDEAARSVTAQEIRLLPAAFSCMPAPQTENTGPLNREHAPMRQILCEAPDTHLPPAVVLSDANGNVLGHRSYVREVYQAFVLSDGFA